MPRRKKTTRWWGEKPKPPVDSSKSRGRFPHEDMPKLRGYERTKCGGRHAGIEWRQTWGDHESKRHCTYCDDVVRGVLSPVEEAKFARTMSDYAAGGKAAKAEARAKRRTPGARAAAGRWTLRKANVSRDAKSGEFRKRRGK